MSLITPENHLVLFAVIVCAAAIGIWSEHKNIMGPSVAAPMAASFGQKN